ncbi:hypothetical protein GQ600_21109 [Phytophthora cactorum]|nr:hypothetical protein GQ600_21109 [Phytophthora cactorum]
MSSAMVLMTTTKKLSLDLDFDGLDRTGVTLVEVGRLHLLLEASANKLLTRETLIIVDEIDLYATDVQAFTSVLTFEHPDEFLFGTGRGKVNEWDATLRSGSTNQMGGC